MLVSAIIGRERAGDQRVADGRRGRRRRRRRSAEAAEEQPPPADHRDDHRLCGDRRGHHRAAAQHGDGGKQGRRQHRLDHELPGPGPALHVDHRLRHPGLADEQDPAVPRHRLRADDPADEPRSHRHADAHQRRALGAGPRARHRHVAALHDRQDDARDPVPAAAERPEAAGEAVRRRHGGSLLEGHRRADRAGADQQDVGPRPGLAATELGQPRR